MLIVIIARCRIGLKLTRALVSRQSMIVALDIISILRLEKDVPILQPPLCWAGVPRLLLQRPHIPCRLDMGNSSSQVRFCKPVFILDCRND